ncbi:Dehydroquinase class I [Corchorus olitorius]|uniref:Dehydroquinase class I n=1 Tax=Corchorus olitorius TaxID=93759 RepID=A0A1R3GB65_9ROSI|nr:Dehydroquinase class I [Corchorus olitorius]
MGSLEIHSTKICAPLMAQSVEQMVKEMHQAKAENAQLVEIRLDCIKNFQPHKDIPFILKNKTLPVIVVYRPKSEGGQYEGDEHLRLQALCLARELGADYIDFELKVGSDLIREQKMKNNGATKVIVSYYINGVTPSNQELRKLADSIRATGADIIKVVANVNDITELSRIFHLSSRWQVPIIAYSEGERGLISQLLCPKYGGFLAYGLIDGHSVPGVPSLYSIENTYKLDYIDPETKVFGLISKPVGHSKGPLLHNPTFRHENFNGVYVPMFVDNLKEFFSTYSSSDFAGFSVGFPYKEAVVEFCDEVHPLAESIGAVNTIVWRPDGKLIGYNTDCEAAIGAIEDALEGTALLGKLFVLVGAGGAGRALAFGAKNRGARVIVFDIDFERAKSLACAVSGEARPFEEMYDFQPEKGAILANATPLGMPPNINQRIPVAEATLGDYDVVFDAVYTPRKTRLLKDADAAGAIIVSGVEMFLRQAIGQYNLFTGLEANIAETVSKVLKENLTRTRPIWEGGHYEGDETKRLDALRLAMDLGANYVDIELEVANDFINSITEKKPDNFEVIVSSHNFQNTPSTQALCNVAARIQATGADIVKIATTALDISDCMCIFEVTLYSKVSTIGVAMGERGLISSLLSPKFGGYLTYGALEGGEALVPGQLTAKLYNFRVIRPDTKVYGIIGNPVDHSKSPLLYNPAFKAAGLNAVFVHFLVNDVDKFFNTYSSPDFAGFTCTMPHKEVALQFMDEIDPIAKNIGATNNIVRRPDGGLTAFNTDYVGAISAIEDRLRELNGVIPVSESPLSGKLFVILGAGGAGKALAYGAAEKGARVVIANRTLERAQELAKKVGGQAISLSEVENFHPEEGMILANTTSVGMKPDIDETPIPKVH